MVGRMLERAKEAETAGAPADPVVVQGRFARDVAEFATTKEAAQ